MVFLPQDATIAIEKLTNYLLLLLPKDDKSQFLAKAGYSLENWQRLLQDLRSQVLSQPAEFVETVRYGDKYQIRASLLGPNGVEIRVLTIWILSDGKAKFVTLIPDKGARS
jgi:hypothetical protein